MVDVSFADLPASLQKRLLELRATGSTLKGLDGEKEALSFFSRKGVKNQRQWNNMRYYLMLRIDKARKSHGLLPIHFVNK
jgi:hypothetical protein